ncbi:MAG TPA: HAMP domain-containing sensor histidine kinase [Acidobacteriota bacterium]|nr:HAMP domain-containing sensor histidine kinase [Acidobacteriota bacterium]
MFKKLHFKTRWIYHPVTVFLLIQVLWILVMAAWIRWYLVEHRYLREMAETLRTQVEVEGLGRPLLEGGVLLTLLLAGATVIFIYWNKQHRLNKMQRAFISNVTHELKSPVASIQLALETIALRDMSEDRKREYIAMMLDDTERLSALIDRILDAARVEKMRGRYHLEPVGMSSFIEEVLREDRHLYEKEGRKILFEKARDAHVAIDRSAMRAVLSNLLENAARYSPPDSVIELKLYRDLGSCRLDVVNSGIGIQRKDINTIFKMFWRGSDDQTARVRGTGLGLYIVRTIVRDHRGKVWASSPGPGRGATISVRLPRVRKYWSLSRRHGARQQNQQQALEK